MLTWNDVLNFASEGNPDPDRTVSKTDEEWQEHLTAEQFNITRLKGTERPFSSDLCELFEPGKYACVCCQTPLFDSGEKFDSGTGWPSFTQPLKDNAIAYHTDSSLATIRIEVICNTCDAHLGHVGEALDEVNERSCPTTNPLMVMPASTAASRTASGGMPMLFLPSPDRSRVRASHVGPRSNCRWAN